MLLYYVLVIWKNIRYASINTLNTIYDYIDIKINRIDYNKKIRSLNSRTLLFVINNYIPRVEKLAYAINEHNIYQIILISKSPIKNIKLISPVKEIFQVRSSLKMIWIVKKLNPVIIHLISSWNFDLGYALIKSKKKLRSRIVFDDYDVFAGMLNKKHVNLYFPKQIKKEKYCLENADGLCCRSLETQYVKQKLKYNISKKRIFFPEYIWNNCNTNIDKKEKKLVYVGNFNTGVLKLAKALEKIDWEIEIFSAYHVTDQNIKSNSNIVIHKPVKPDKLIEFISKYPVAIQFPGCILDQHNTLYTKEKYRYAASGKIFDYLESGLKVLISDELFQLWLLKHYGMVIEINANDPINDIVKKLSIFETQKKHGTNIKYDHLTLKKQSERLINFYNSLFSEN